MLEPGPNHGDFLAPDRQRRGADGEHKQGQPKQQTAVALHHYTKFGEVAPEMTAIANKAPMVVGARMTRRMHAINSETPEPMWPQGSIPTFVKMYTDSSAPMTAGTIKPPNSFSFDLVLARSRGRQYPQQNPLHVGDPKLAPLGQMI